MKVVLINGSRNEKGCTYTALSEIAKVLNENDIDTQIIFVGEKVLNGQINEAVKETTQALKDVDGLVVGSPVYYASPTGEVIAFMDRLLGAARNELKFKPAAAITSARRAGTTATIDVLNKYFMFNQMPIVSSAYWNMVHGNTPDEVSCDIEGVQIMRILGKNMAWLIKSIAVAKENGVDLPSDEPIERTNFIR